jgi:ABC-type amino acid transport substrate-binding protein
MIKDSKVPKFKIHQKASVYHYKNFEPVIYGEGNGFEADLLKAIFKYWDVEYDFHPTEDYEDMWLKPGDSDSIYDIAAGGIDPGARDTNSKVCYSIATANYSQSLLILKKKYVDKVITSYKSFAQGNMSIGVIGNTTGETYGKLRAEEHELPSTIFKRFEKESEMLDALLADEIQAIARGSIGNEYQEMKNENLLTIEKKSFGEMTAYALDPRNEHLKDALNSAITLITDNRKLSYPEWLANHKIFYERIEELDA